jgi:hypothetical protein
MLHREADEYEQCSLCTTNPNKILDRNKGNLRKHLNYGGERMTYAGSGW